MSLAECDLTGSIDRVEPVHEELKRVGLEKVCFRIGVKLEDLRQSCHSELIDYHAPDKRERLAEKIDKALEKFLNTKEQTAPTTDEVDPKKEQPKKAKTKKK